MKVLVVGTGSIGRRHAQNLRDLGHEVFAFSERRSRGLAHEEPANTAWLERWSDAQGMGFDCAVIANRSDQHLASARAALEFCNALYIEKPLSHSLAGVRELVRVCAHRASVVELGFMLRFHPNLLWIKDFLQSGQLGEVLHCRSSVGQWLPDWRPGTDHRLSFAASYRYGGGVTMELIHELDLVSWLLGEVTQVCAMQRNVPQLEIETEAIAEICLQLSSGLLAQVHLDCVRPGYARSLEILGSKGVLTWDYVQSTVLVSNAQGRVVAQQVLEGFERNQLFVRAMRHMAHRVADGSAPAVASLEEGVQSLRVALASHQSARQRRFISPQEVDENFSLE